MLLNILTWIFGSLMIGGVLFGGFMLVYLCVGAIKEEFHKPKCHYEYDVTTYCLWNPHKICEDCEYYH